MDGIGLKIFSRAIIPINQQDGLFDATPITLAQMLKRRLIKMLSSQCWNLL